MKEVVVIGAGPSGLASIRSLIKYKDKVNITVYEVSDRVGGLWVNRDPYKTTPMYDNLRANLPKEIAGFPGYPYPTDVDESYLTHSRMLKYMEGFARDIDMYQYIKFRHKVIEVDPFTRDNGTERWYVTVRNEETGAMTTKQFDAVMVCSGHESKPYIPDIAGMKTFPGEIMHSLYYQNPDYFKDKAVVVVGAGFSGLDIVLELAPSAKKIYLSHHNEQFTAPLPDKTEAVPDISKIDGDGIILTDGRVIQADIILLATGYRYEFSFLSERCRPEVKDEHVTNIYRMMVDINHPSLYYIGLSKLGLILPHLCVQSDLAAVFISDAIPPVCKEEMKKEYEELYRKKVTDPGRAPKHFHTLLEDQFEYADIVMKQSKVITPGWKLAEKMFQYTFLNFGKSMENFRKVVYRVTGDEDYEIVYIPPELQV